MSSQRQGWSMFYISVFLLFVHSACPFLWVLMVIPSAYPWNPTQGWLMVLPGFTPPT